MNSSQPKPALIRRAWFRLLLALVLLHAAFVSLVRPSNERDWAVDQSRLPIATIAGDHLTIENVRHARYRSVSDFDLRWETRHYRLNDLQSVWFIVEPFADWRGPAHTFLSFGFTDGAYLAISVEIRKEKGEAFSPVLGLLRQYELAYVIGDERDLIGLRANHRGDEVYLYPVRATPGQARALLESMLRRVNELVQHPEFYNTLSNTCTSNIVDHIEVIAPGRIPLSYKTLLPAYSDDLAYDLGLLDTDLPRESYRAAHKVNDLAAQFADREDFSVGIRSRFSDRRSQPGDSR